MKAVIDVGASSGTGSNLSGVQNGRVNRKKDVENEEIQMYLSKLKDLVPFMPKNKKLSKLEVIQYVIDYICDLQYALETHPSVNNFNAVELTARLQGENGTPVTTVPPTAPNGAHRQPLGVLAPSPNTIISTVSSNALAAVPMEHASLQSDDSHLKAADVWGPRLEERAMLGPFLSSQGPCSALCCSVYLRNKPQVWCRPTNVRCHLYTWKKSKRLIVGQFRVKNVSRHPMVRTRMSFMKVIITVVIVLRLLFVQQRTNRRASAVVLRGLESKLPQLKGEQGSLCFKNNGANFQAVVYA